MTIAEVERRYKRKLVTSRDAIIIQLAHL